MAVCNCELIQPESCVSNAVLRRGCVCLCWSLGPVRTRGHHSLGLEVFRPPRGVRAGTRHPWTLACSVSTPKAAVPHRSRGSRSESAPPQGRVLPLLYAQSPGNVALRGPSLPPCPSARPFILVFPCFPYFISGSSMFDLFCVFILYPAFLDIPWREFLCTPRCIPEMEGLNAASPSVKMIILLPVNVASYSALSSRVIREFSG